jgi:hypothetical protein
MRRAGRSADESVESRGSLPRSSRTGRRWGVLAAALIGMLALGGPLSASAANQEVNHFRDVGTDVDPDFCGTGKQVDVEFDVRVTEWFAPHNGDYKSVATGFVTLTNPLTGDAVINRFSGPFWAEVVSGDPDGLHVFEVTTKGLAEMFKTPHGGVLTRDAGYIQFHDTFDGEEFVGGEIVINKGPHPQADSDFELFCQIIPEALGL